MGIELRPKSELLGSLMAQYFGRACPALVRKLDAALWGLPLPARREIAGRLRAIEAIARGIERARRGPRLHSEGDAASLDEAIAQMERLMEAVDGLLLRLDELSKVRGV